MLDMLDMLDMRDMLRLRSFCIYFDAAAAGSFIWK